MTFSLNSWGDIVAEQQQKQKRLRAGCPATSLGQRKLAAPFAQLLPVVLQIQHAGFGVTKCGLGFWDRDIVFDQPLRRTRCTTDRDCEPCRPGIGPVRDRLL